MPKLTYSSIMSLDGYVADDRGNFDWAAPDTDVHSYVNDLERSVGTYLYGRRMYEVMVAWESMEVSKEQSPATWDFAAIWRAADKIVYSRTLGSVSSARTRIEREFNPEAIRAMKVSGETDISIGGPHLANRALDAGLVDECQVFITPIVVGSGTPAFPRTSQVKFELLDEHRFASGVLYLRYRTVG